MSASFRDFHTNWSEPTAEIQTCSSIKWMTCVCIILTLPPDIVCFMGPFSTALPTNNRSSDWRTTTPSTCTCRSIAVCCSVLQCAAVCCSVLQCVAVSCSVLQCVAVCCSVLQCANNQCPDWRTTTSSTCTWRSIAVCCRVLQCVAVSSIVAVCCSVLQCAAVCEQPMSKLKNNCF